MCDDTCNEANKLGSACEYATVGGHEKPSVICSFSIPQEKTSVNTKWDVWCARTSIQNPHEEGVCGLGVLPQKYIEILTF